MTTTYFSSFQGLGLGVERLDRLIENVDLVFNLIDLINNSADKRLSTRINLYLQSLGSRVDDLVKRSLLIKTFFVESFVKLINEEAL